MSFMELAKKRYSVRSFQDRKVEEEKLLYILEAARLAPSAVNYQPYRFIVVTDQKMKDKIYECYPRDWFKKAPVVIVVCGDRRKSWKRGSDNKDHMNIDAAIATEHMALAAAEMGLGTCWVCAFDASKCHDVLELPDYMEAIALLPLGYPESLEAPEKKRKELKELVMFNKYQE